MNPSPLIIYHAACRDGFCAAWAANKAFHDGETKIEFFPAFHGTPAPDVKGRTVYIIDFCYPREVMEQLRADAEYLTVLDHHKTAQAALDGFTGPYVHVEFDMQRSGAGIAWDYFNRRMAGARPWLVDYVEDRDLWRHALPNSNAVNAYIGTLPFTFEAWDHAEASLASDEAAVIGHHVEAKVAQYIAEVKKNSRRVTFEGVEVPVVNAPQPDISELLDGLGQGEAFSVGWWQRADGYFSYSLRSREPSNVDVSAIAQKYGGGGHARAAGFQLREFIL